MTDSTATGWYFSKRGAPAGQQAGPFTWEQLYAHARAGTLNSDDLVWHAQLPGWVPGAQIPGLFAAPTVPAAAYPPGAAQPGGAQPAPRRRSRLLLVLIPLIAVIVIGGGLGSYFAFRHGGGGGGSNTTSSVEPTAGALGPRIEEAADNLLSTWGNEPSFFLVMWALDRGYDAQQIVEAALEDRMVPDGTILSAGGAVASPARPPEGLLQPVGVGSASEEAAAKVRTVAWRAEVEPQFAAESVDRPQDAGVEDLGDVFLSGIAAGVRDEYRKLAEGERQEEQLSEEERKAYQEFSENLAQLVIGLAVRGYSVRQIAWGIWLSAAQVDFTDEGDDWCVSLATADGLVRPEYPPADVLGELICPPIPEGASTELIPGSYEKHKRAPQDDGTTWIYEGTGLFWVEYPANGDEPPVVCEDPAVPYRLELYSDGTAALHIAYLLGLNENRQCQRTVEEGRSYGGSHDEGHFKVFLVPGFDNGITGTYDEETASGSLLTDDLKYEFKLKRKTD